MTEILRLVPIARDGQVAALAEDEPGAVQDVIAQTISLYRRRGFEPPWIGYLAAEQGAWVGTCGFAGPPRDGEVEIAYYTFAHNEGRRIASRMAAALLSETGADAERQGLVVIAHTLAQDGASTRILRRLGFSLLGTIEHPEDGQVWKWRRSPA